MTFRPERRMQCMADLYSNAEAYDNYMGRWSVRLAPLFMDFARIRDGDRVLAWGAAPGPSRGR